VTEVGDVKTAGVLLPGTVVEEGRDVEAALVAVTTGTAVNTALAAAVAEETASALATSALLEIGDATEPAFAMGALLLRVSATLGREDFTTASSLVSESTSPCSLPVSALWRSTS